MNFRFIAIIPARYHSTRFEGKPLCDIDGKKMIIRTLEQVSKVDVFSVIMTATDDERIKNVVTQAGYKAVMTPVECSSGTDRCAAVLDSLDCNLQNTVVCNIQGDEPFIKPQQIEELIACFDDQNTQIATLCGKIIDKEMLANRNIVKVVLNKQGNALYFSRSEIPFLRNAHFETHTFYRHIGIYAYRAHVLQNLVKLPVSNLEKAESLEQLRWLEEGYVINVKVSQFKPPVGIDTPEDISKALQYLQNY